VSLSVTKPYRSSIQRLSVTCLLTLENFDRFRSRVETAASRKFDSHGFDAEKYEGMPAIRLTADDMM
jgi:hypothetical protein